ncbi:MAG: tetratricopeptide repeat protein [Actinomycetota bacterium]
MPGSKLTSIIILAYNQLEYTKLCIESIYRYTIPPFELILVDNGSTDGTSAYFNSIVGAKVITNKVNLGFAKGCNQGIKIAEGDYILLLNNDVIVTECWLENMIECLESDPSIGIVGPRSNYVSGPQFIEVDYKSIEALHSFAREFNRQGSDKWFDLDVAIGFCMLIKREVINKVGLLDERYGIGNFEDNDFCMRAKMAGYRIVCAGNTFIHHFGNRTFIGNDLPLQNLLIENKRIFDKKWGLEEHSEQALQGKDNLEQNIKNLTHSMLEALYLKVKLAADKFETERGRLSRLFHQGLIYYVDRKYKEALKIFQELAESLPSSFFVKHALALTLMMIGRFEEARPLFFHLLEQQSNNADLLLAYGDCLVMLGELDDAERQYKEAIKLKSSLISARIGLAVVEKIKSQPEILKFLRDLEALVNLKSQLAKEQGEHFSVTYLTVNHGIAGASKIYFEQINRLIDRGHKVHVVSHWSQPEWFDLNTEVITVPLDKGLYDYVPPESDVVIATFWSQMHELLRVRNAVPVYLAQGDRYLFERNEEKRQDKYDPVMQQLADRSHNLPVSIFVVSEGLRELIQEYYDRESYLIPNAIDLNLFKPGRRRKREKPKLLMIGSDELVFKGLNYINKAFQQIKRLRDVEVVWVSPKPRTSLSIKCDTFIQAPSQEELAKIYADCDVFVSASIYEGFSLPPIEAMACGTPVVVAVNEGTKGYVRDGRNCLTVPIRDADAIFKAVNHLLDDDLLRERIIKGGLETAARYNWQRTIDLLEEKLWNLTLAPKPPFAGVLPEEAIEGSTEEVVSIAEKAEEDRENDYYHFQRSDVIELVPITAKRILDVGCAAGIVGKALKERGAIEVVGVEIVESIAEEAEQYLDRVIVGDIEQIDLDYEEGHFDCIILADVLEHLYNPWQTLTKLRRYLSPDGKVVCSIPNIGHVSILRDFLNGSWKYEEAGILDITHLRFFTLEGAFALLMTAGFKVDNVVNKVICSADEEAFLAKLKASGLASDAYLQNAPVFQFLLTAAPFEGRLEIPDDSSTSMFNKAENTPETGGVSSKEQAQDGKMQLPDKKPKLSLAMIVRDEADNLGRCLKSVQGVVDEIIVVDTGSTDNSVVIAKKFGAKVIHYKWEDDFSAARNVSLDHATGEWVMFLDADEELVSEDIDELKKVLEDTEREGFYFNLLSFIGEKEEDGAVVNIAFRLWRNKPEYRFTGAIHEQIVAKVQSHNPNIGFTGIRINHYGYLTKITKEKDKIQRNLNILLKEVEKYPDDPFVRFNLGVEYLRLKDYVKALDQYKKAFANLTGLDVAYASMLVRNIALCLKELGRYEEALKILQDAKEAYPDYTDLFYLEGLVYLEKRDFMSAIECLKTSLAMGPAGKVHISQSGVSGYMAANALGGAYRAIGDEKEAIASYKKALEDNPRDCLTLSQLGLMLVNREKPDDLKKFLESLVDMTSEDILFTLTFIFNEGGYYEISLSYLDKLINDNSNPSRAALLRGECLLNLKQYQQAIAEFDKIPLPSQYYQASVADKTICYLLIGEYDNAEKAIDSIKDHEDFNLIYRLYSSLISLIKGRPPSISLTDKQKEQAQKIVADLLRKFLELEEYEIFEKAVGLLEKLGITSGEIGLLIGKIYYDMGFNEMAVEELIHAYENGCADGEAFFILGRTAFSNGFYEEAKTFFYEAVNREIEEISLYIYLSRTLIKLGEMDEAVKILDMGAKKYPNSPLISEIKQSISALV